MKERLLTYNGKTQSMSSKSAKPTLSTNRSVPRRGLSRVEAAMYIGISPSKFDQLREDGRIGPAKLIDARKLFAIEMLDDFFDALPDENHDGGGDWTASV
jgi:hypothetical protein